MNLEKIKKILKSKKGIVASGVIVGTIVIGIIGGVLVNGASKSNDIAENNKPVINNKKEDNKKDKDESVVSKENNNAEDKKEEVKETESKIGRASCRESVFACVDLGGRRIIKKKKVK